MDNNNVDFENALLAFKVRILGRKIHEKGRQEKEEGGRTSWEEKQAWATGQLLDLQRSILLMCLRSTLRVQ